MKKHILKLTKNNKQSLIVSPREGAEVRDSHVEVKGWAYSGGGRGIVRVEVSLDGGETWKVRQSEGGRRRRGELGEGGSLFERRFC